jgi:uncharacterized protein (DUF362 family)/Pyruvate/2-oxoacid:ferredoxin oxidoreductase delta subunit
MPDKSTINNPKVCIQKNTYKNINLESLLKPLDSIKNYVKNGENVLLKTNLLTPSYPEKAVVTHPDIIRSVAISIIKAGGVPFIGDSPSGPFTKRRLEKSYNKSGLKYVSKDLGIELNYDTRTKKIEIPNGKKLKKASICNFFLQADKTIALPKIKTHSYMIMTLATKIMYGVIPGLTKAKYHSMFIRRKSFAEMLIDILSITKPDLIITDGIVGMQGDGPAGGDPVEIGVILASENAVAMDLAICKILNIEPIGIPTLKEAKIRDMWPQNISYPILLPNDVKFDKFILPSTASYLITGKKVPDRYPIPVDNCTACALCVDICPKDIIEIIDNIAKINYSKCIKCYCCHEICPYDAIKLDVIK